MSTVSSIISISIRAAANGYVATIAKSLSAANPIMMPGNSEDMVFSSLDDVTTYLKANGFGVSATAASSSTTTSSTTTTT